MSSFRFACHLVSQNTPTYKNRSNGSNYPEHSSGGTGCGLYVAGQLVASLGESVSLSNRDGGGASLCIEFPAFTTDDDDFLGVYPPIYQEFGNWHASKSHSADVCIVDNGGSAGKISYSYSYSVTIFKIRNSNTIQCQTWMKGHRPAKGPSLARISSSP